MRNGKSKFLKVKIGKQPEESEEVASANETLKPQKWLGLKVSSISPALARKFGITENEKGVVVLKVEQGSAARVAGILPGDVIKQINGKKIKSLKDFDKFVKKYGDKGSFLFLIKRKGSLFYLTVENE